MWKFLIIDPEKIQHVFLQAGGVSGEIAVQL